MRPILPMDIVLVRHGQSELNEAGKASRKGDNHFFTPEFRNTHSRNFRLTDLGVRQSKIAGEWLKKNVPMPLDRFYVSDYIRAKETAGYLDLPQAEWESKLSLRERDLALMYNCPEDEKKRLFELEIRQYEIDPFLSYPAGGGESIAALCHRLKTDFVSHLDRECANKRVIVVCHGRVMQALQLLFENLGHDEFIRLDSSKNPEDRILNCQIFWYTRRDPRTLMIRDRFIAVRSVCPLFCPTDTEEDWGWRFIQRRRRYSNQDLLEEVSRYPRHI